MMVNWTEPRRRERAAAERHDRNHERQQEQINEQLEKEQQQGLSLFDDWLYWYDVADGVPFKERWQRHVKRMERNANSRTRTTK